MMTGMMIGCGENMSIHEAKVKFDGLHRQIYQSEVKSGGKALVTKELYDQLKTGMSQQEVVKTIAAPESNPVKMHSPKEDEAHIIELNEDGRKIILKYRGNTLHTKEQIGIE
jgi:hypothetical protein